MSGQAACLGLQQHCWQLAEVLTQLWEHDPVTLVEEEKESEFADAAAWLHMAAGVVKVDVDTARFDDSVMWCGGAAKFEDARSELYSRLAAELTIFLFVWGAFETVAKVIGPAPIPPDRRARGANGLVDRVLYQLHEFTPFSAYEPTLRELIDLMATDPRYSASALHRSPGHVGPSGLGLNLVRQIRNRFAHGSGNLPMPNVTDSGWCGKASPTPQIISLSSRIVLLTTQMLLSSYYARHRFTLRVLTDEDGLTADADIHVVLRRLHQAAEVADSA